MNDFSKRTIAALAHKGITLVGLTIIPDMSSSMPYANGTRAYVLDDDGCQRIRSFAEVLELAGVVQ